MTLRCVSLALGLVAGILAAALAGWVLPGWLLVLTGLVGLAGSSWSLVRERNWLPTPRLLVAIAAILLTFPVGNWRAAQWVRPPAEGSLREAFSVMEEGVSVGLSGTVCAEPERRGPRRCDIRMRVDRIRVADATDWVAVSPGTVLLRTTVSSRSGAGSHELFRQLSRPAAYGYRLEVQSTYRPAEPPLNPGEFDRPRFLRQSGLVGEFKCHVSRIRVTEESRGFFLTEIALAAKQHFLETYRRTIRSPASRLVAAATLGARRSVENIDYAGLDIPEMFRHAGVGHVLAVSGLHVSVVSLLLFSVFVATGIRPRVFTPMLILFLILFALLTGARPSSMRAVVMNAAVLSFYAYTRCNLRDATYVGLALSASIIAMIRPLVLFAPSFLLSYGAVLSLVLIAPSLDRWLLLLRGGSLFLFAAWFVGLMLTLAFAPHVWLDATNVASAVALLWLAVYLGARWNERNPRLWAIGLNCAPAPLRLFIAAQLAIQVGMMVPMSAWFFGRFPAAGIVVNLLAIPAIGVLVQLGILVGLLGLIPVLGLYIALPFGAIASLMGGFFFALAYAGTRLFPFIAVPKPTANWMLGYYLTVAAVLLLQRRARRLHACLMRAWRMVAGRRWVRAVPYAVAVVVLALPALRLLPRDDTTRAITCAATRDFPLLTVVSRANRAVVLNGGDRFTGDYLLFDLLRTQGAASVDLALLTGTHPRSGNAGMAALMQKMPVRQCRLPYVAAGETPYLDGIGDAYLAQQARNGVSWALDYAAGYDALRDAAAAQSTPLVAWGPDAVAPWTGLQVSCLPRLDEPPERFASSAMTRVLHADVNGFEWVVVTDSTVAALERAATGLSAGCDVLVLPALGYRKTYEELVVSAVDRFAPRVVIVPGERTALLDRQFGAGASGPLLFCMAEDGAVTATFPDAGMMHLTAFRGSRSKTLRVR